MSVSGSEERREPDRVVFPHAVADFRVHDFQNESVLVGRLAEFCARTNDGVQLKESASLCECFGFSPCHFFTPFGYECIL